METCKYEPAEWIPNRYPRRKYISACNFILVNLFDEIWDGGAYISNPPTGKCMKCHKQIFVEKEHTNEKDNTSTT